MRRIRSCDSPFRKPPKSRTTMRKGRIVSLLRQFCTTIGVASLTSQQALRMVGPVLRLFLERRLLQHLQPRLRDFDTGKREANQLKQVNQRIDPLRVLEPTNSQWLPVEEARIR